jgi:hypothetical protein
MQQTGMTIRPTDRLGPCLKARGRVDVRAWRLCWLLDAGFDAELAATLADASVDLHALLELVDQGCPPALAARILAPLPGQDRPA